MNAHRTGIRVLGLVIVVAASACGSSKDTAEPKLKIDPRSGAGYTSRAQSYVATGDGLALTLTKFEKSYDGTSYSFIKDCYLGIPGRISESSGEWFCYGSFHPPSSLLEVDTGFYFYYDILIPDGSGGWKPSGYYVDAATKVPLFGTPRIDCTIRQSGGATPTHGAPFRCETSFTGEGNDSDPHWKITANPVQVIDASNVANAERAAQLIADNCQIVDTVRCSWTRTQKSSAFLPDRNDWQSLTNWADSCPPTDPNRPFVLNSTRNVQISWSDKVGGKISGKVAAGVILAKVELTVEANYEHTITQTDSYGEGYTYTIPYKYRSALYLQHGLLQVTGDFSIITDNGERFLVKNAVFQFPLQKDVQVEGRGQPIPRGVVQHVDVPCSEALPLGGAPPPASASTGVVGGVRP